GMMGDNIEHVITYWVLWQTFESPALVGFQLISHWLPFLLLSVYAGSLAERFDCRRLIQIGQIMFMVVSLCWGILFLTDSLQLWQACVLLVVHGLAGCLWGPAEQMMLHDFVDRKELPSAVRLNATFRSLGILFGPVVGSALLLGVGATWGIFINIVLYLPLTLFLIRTPLHRTPAQRRGADGQDDAAGIAEGARRGPPQPVDHRHAPARRARLDHDRGGAANGDAGVRRHPQSGRRRQRLHLWRAALRHGRRRGARRLRARSDRVDQGSSGCGRAGCCGDGCQLTALRSDLPPVGGRDH